MEINQKSDIREQVETTFTPNHHEGHPGEIVPDLVQQYTRLWWSCDGSFPIFDQIYTRQEQGENEKRLELLIKELPQKLKDSDRNPCEIKTWVSTSRPDWTAWGRRLLHLEQEHFDLIESSGIMEALQEFVRMARSFDAGISAEDIYQAGRNVMTANFIQMLLGIPVRVSPSIFAYSMLYPYTDNYLDNLRIPNSTKLAFNRRFRERLMGKTVIPANAYELTITRLIEMIEGEWERQTYPQVYESLLAIHTAQTRSLLLAGGENSPFELDILGISLEKGGTSVLADGYLAAGELTRKQASLLFGFGSFTQLMDDLEDIQQDLGEKRASLFSITAGRWPLDRLTNQLIHYGKTVAADLSGFPAPSIPLLHEIMAHCLEIILVNTAANAGAYYGADYLKRL